MLQLKLKMKQQQIKDIDFQMQQQQNESKSTLQRKRLELHELDDKRLLIEEKLAYGQYSPEKKQIRSRKRSNQSSVRNQSKADSSKVSRSSLTHGENQEDDDQENTTVINKKKLKQNAQLYKHIIALKFKQGLEQGYRDAGHVNQKNVAEEAASSQQQRKRQPQHSPTLLQLQANSTFEMPLHHSQVNYSQMRRQKAAKSFERLREAPRPVTLQNSHSRILESFGLKSKGKMKGVSIPLDQQFKEKRNEQMEPMTEKQTKQFHKKRAKQMIQAIRKECKAKEQQASTKTTQNRVGANTEMLLLQDQLEGEAGQQQKSFSRIENDIYTIEEDTHTNTDLHQNQLQETSPHHRTSSSQNRGHTTAFSSHDNQDHIRRCQPPNGNSGMTGISSAQIRQSANSPGDSLAAYLDNTTSTNCDQHQPRFQKKQPFLNIHKENRTFDSNSILSSSALDKPQIMTQMDQRKSLINVLASNHNLNCTSLLQLNQNIVNTSADIGQRKKHLQKDELEKEVCDQFGQDNLSKKNKMKMHAMKENYREQKEHNGGQTSIHEKVEHLQFVRESLKGVKKEKERVTPDLIPPQILTLEAYQNAKAQQSQEQSRKNNIRACRCKRQSAEQHADESKKSQSLPQTASSLPQIPRRMQSQTKTPPIMQKEGQQQMNHSQIERYRDNSRDSSVNGKSSVGAHIQSSSQQRQGASFDNRRGMLDQQEDTSVLKSTSELLSKHYQQPVQGRNKRLVKIGTNFKLDKEKNSLNQALGAAAVLPEAKSTSLIDRIQQKFSINKEDMRQYRVPGLQQEIITDEHLDAELARMQKQTRDKQRKMISNASKLKRSIEVKYADLILNRNSSQYVSKSSQISNKMLGSMWLRGHKDQHFFRDFDLKSGGSLSELSVASGAALRE